MAVQNFFSRGKLLISGEYAVLDGGIGLAVPTKLGQKMQVKKTTKSDLQWKSYDKEGKIWFESKIDLIDFNPSKTTDTDKSMLLKRLLKGAVRLNSEFLSKWNGFNVTTHLEFPLEWGLGSSSTLTHLVADWAEVHPLLLYFKVFNGSGYDVASAMADSPITYQLDGDDINYTPIDFDPAFKDKLHFVYLNQKQSSTAGIEHYLKNAKKKKALAKDITKITEDMIAAKSLSAFMELMQKHEALISTSLGLDKVQDLYFKDFDGVVKSLGSWGGDFALVASSQKQEDV